MRFSSATMWLWVVLWRATALLVVSGTLNLNFFTQKRQYVPTTQMNCYDYPKFNTEKLSTAFNRALTSQGTATRNHMPRPYPGYIRRQTHKIMPRSLNIVSFNEEIYREHAKLVQDINGLKQVVFVAPLVDDNRDYDESIFHEIIETASPSPSTIRPKPQHQHQPNIKQTSSSSIPIILVGGASSKQMVKSQPFNYNKPTINLVGTTMSPIIDHPYPFVVHQTTRPFRVCMPAMTMYPSTTQRPSLWQRIIKSIIPR